MDSLQKFLEHVAYNMRVSTLKMTTQAGSGHPTSALSAADLVAALFFYAMHFDPKNPKNQNNDRFILSKGHASPILYAVWKELGVLSEQDLMTYQHFNSRWKVIQRRIFHDQKQQQVHLGKDFLLAWVWH